MRYSHSGSQDIFPYLHGSKAYEVLAPILEKYGEIDLDEYREATA